MRCAVCTSLHASKGFCVCVSCDCLLRAAHELVPPSHPPTLQAAVEALSTSLSLSLSCASLCLHHLHLKGAGGVEGLLVAVTIPILREADLVHSCVWRILELLQQGCTILQLSAEGLGAAQALALLHHSALRVLYDKVRKDPALAMQVQPPVLPDQPPCLAPPPFISTDSLPK